MEHMHTSNDFTDVFIIPCWILDWRVGGKIHILFKILHTHFEDRNTECS